MFAIRARVSCSVALKLAIVAGAEGQVIAGLKVLVLRFTESNPSISAFPSRDGHFLIIVPADFWFLLDLIGCRPIRISTDNNHSS